MLYTIMKDGLYVEEFSRVDDMTFTKSKKHKIHFYKKSDATKFARELGRKYGKGFSVVECLYEM